MNNQIKQIIYCSKCGNEFTQYGNDLKNKLSPCCSFPYTFDYRAIQKRLAKFELKIMKKIGEQ